MCRIQSVAISIFLMLSLSWHPTAAEQDTAKEERKRRVEEASVIKKYPPRDWANAYTYESRFYDIMTNTSPEVASYIGQLMDFAQMQFRQIFSFTGEIDRMKVNAYRSLPEYQEIAKEAGLPGSLGLFMRKGTESTIHLAYISLEDGQSPTQVLLHEGTHQFISSAMDFSIPAKALRHFPPGLTTLSSVPLWLNEGMATYIENSWYDGSELATGGINRGRLLQLQFEIRKGNSVGLKKLFSTGQKAFTSSHYAAAWGITYWFLHDSDERKQRLKRMILKDYFDACRRGFMENPEEEFRVFLEKDFLMLWQKHLEEKQLSSFINITIGDRGSFSKWEKSWQKWILALDPEDPYGGLVQ